jgi:hypothetical protein
MNSEKTDLLLTQNTDKLLQIISERANIKISSLEQLKESLTQSKAIRDQLVALEKQKTILEKQLKESTAEG